MFPQFYKGLLHEVFGLVHVAIGEPAGVVAQGFVPAPEYSLESRFVAKLKRLCQLVFVLILQISSRF